PMRRRLAWGLVMAAILALGCGGDPVPSSTGAGGAGGAGGGPTAGFKVRGSVEQIHVWKAPPATKLEVRDAGGEVVQSGTTDAQGSLVFRGVPPGEGYAVRAPDLVPPEVQQPVRVMSVPGSAPGADFYKGQQLKPGYNYITTRDGTQLAAYITLPGPPDKGPYPTVVNYSGYDPARPGEPIDGYQALCSTIAVFCDAPA